MDQKLQELYQNVVNLSTEEKIIIGGQSERIVLKYLTDNFKSEDAAVIYALLIGTYVGIDGELSKEEYAFVRAVFELELPVEAFCELVRTTCTAESVEIVDKLIDSAPTDVKMAFVTLGLALCSIDDSISPAEQALLTKYIE